MKEVNMIGIDLAKNIFQLHCSDSFGKVLWKKKIKRDQLKQLMVNTPKCTVVMESCGGSHYWARKFIEMGHDAKLIAPKFVKPFVKTNKNDANDAEAIVEAAMRPNMRFVAVKTKVQQETLCFHRIRERLVRNRTALANEIRGLMTEFGVVFPQGISKIREYIPTLVEDATNELSDFARKMFQELYQEYCWIDKDVKKVDGQIEELAKGYDACKKIMKVPGIGPLSATAIVATIGYPQFFKNGRHLSAYFGFVPRQHSRGGKENLLGISKRGDVYEIHKNARIMIDDKNR